MGEKLIWGPSVYSREMKQRGRSQLNVPECLLSVDIDAGRESYTSDLTIRQVPICYFNDAQRVKRTCSSSDRVPHQIPGTVKPRVPPRLSRGGLPPLRSHGGGSQAGTIGPALLNPGSLQPGR
jgi:hypothetical protein